MNEDKAPSRGSEVDEIRVLVTGASGYVGGRLVPRLIEAGARVRVVGRDAARLRAWDWSDAVEIVEADLTDAQAVAEAVADVDSVVFLVHAMGGGAGFAEREKQMAQIMAQSAARAGVGRIVYLSGLHPDGVHLSEHMASREAVAEILRESDVPTTIVQAATVIGSGSASFEIIRHLAERLPVMPAPSWVSNRIEPVAIADVLHYLTACVTARQPLNGTYEVGSGERHLRFRDLLTQYAEVAGLPKRRVYALPIPAPRLSGFWIGLVTPIPFSLARPLAASMQHEAITHGNDLSAVVPAPPDGPTPYRDAVAAALAGHRDGKLPTTWSDDADQESEPASPLPNDPDWAGETVYTDARERCDAAVDPAALWRVIEGIGGRNGWYSSRWLWRTRGLLDRLAGGYGLRRGRRDNERLRVGDAVDWWRVEAISPERQLTLRAEMRTGGRAWLQLSVEAGEGGGAIYRQRAVFLPDGLFGRLYWWAIKPFHGIIFPTMAKEVMARARQLTEEAPQQ
ncbi:SDR family oxidoreductase [Parenemella sanctibonifatiensis]|uniref:NAD(P)-dependent oxidoreductase n=1 Tax=Parenemella sanctibonifatiensis TaxID=2016505 RepID=A0A255EB39_9ACTN|nr:SDR family oxidoreductase [Parenemella sanctibonifatiensis]OYN88470.1 NAD(P)-dependent oxidoreductase [Parenemella sanctibonifatiensis]